MVLPKKVQVLHQLLSQIRQRSPAKLKWWGRIESLGLFAWGVGRITPLLTLSYFGTLTSAATRDRLLSELFGPNHHERLITSLTSLAVIVFIIDNYQVGQCLKNQQSGHSSNFMSGTNQIAEKPRLYDNPEYNNVKPKSELQYNCNETYPSPDGMAPYESLDRKSHAAFFTSHASASSAPKS